MSASTIKLPLLDSIQKSRLDNLGWRLWYCQQKTICPREHKFQLIEQEEEEYTSDEEDFDQDLLFEKTYQISAAPVSLLTEMLQPPTLKRCQAKVGLHEWFNVTQTK